MSENILLWHRNDLRLSDNPALIQAADAERVNPVFIFDPHFYSSDKVGKNRLRFLHESLEQLDQIYKRYNINLSFWYGEPEKVLPSIADEHGISKIIYNTKPTVGYAKKRDEKIRSWEIAEPINKLGIVHSKSNDCWRTCAEKYLTSTPYEAPSELNGGIESQLEVDEINKKFDISYSKEHKMHGGCRQAQKRLQEFSLNIEDYHNHLSNALSAEKKCSRLSPYLRFGCLSLREVYYNIMGLTGQSEEADKYLDRLKWNLYFTQKLKNNPHLTEKAINPIYRDLNRETHKNTFFEAWKHGKTGFPIIDAGMRALKKTGWMSFRIRALCASFYTIILRCWWKLGADWFYKKLVDADPGINYAQWQLQSGLIGRNPIEAFDPERYSIENDCSDYIEKYVPELSALPSERIHAPHKTPPNVLSNYDVNIGDDYPYPIVDFGQRRAISTIIRRDIKESLGKWKNFGDIW